MKRREFLKQLIFMATGVSINKASISCSIWPLYLIIKEIINTNKVSLKTIVPQWKDPHSYLITPEDKTTIDKALLSFEIGLGLEKKFGKQLIALGNNYPNLIGAHKVDNRIIANPHIWLDPKIVRDYMIPVISDNLIKRFPSFVNIKKIKTFEEKLTKIDKRVKSDLSEVRTVPFITQEGAFDYFARTYHLRLLGHVERDGSRVGTNVRRLYNLVKIIKKQHIHVLFIHIASSIEPYRIFEKDYGLEVHRLNPLGYGLNSYESMIYKNEMTVLKALKNKKQVDA